MSVPPQGVGPRGTLPLGIGLALPSPYASRHAEREYRATVRPPALGPCVLRPAPEVPAPELPEWEGFDGPGPESEPAAVEPHGSAQDWGDVAKAPRAPALRAPVRLRGRWSATRAIITALGAIGIAGFVVNMYARPELRQAPELPELRQAPELHAAQVSPAPSAPEPAPSAAPTSNPASAPTSPAHAASTARARQSVASPSTARAIVPKSDIVDPWRH